MGKELESEGDRESFFAGRNRVHNVYQDFLTELKEKRLNIRGEKISLENPDVNFFLDQNLDWITNEDSLIGSFGYEHGALFCYELIKQRLSIVGEKIPKINIKSICIYMFDITGIYDEDFREYFFEDKYEIDENKGNYQELLRWYSKSRNKISKKMENDDPELFDFYKNLELGLPKKDKRFVNGMRNGILDIYHLFKSHSQRQELEQILNLPLYEEPDEASC